MTQDFLKVSRLAFAYCLSRKNIRVSGSGIATWFRPLAMDWLVVTSVQFVVVRSGFCCNVKPPADDGHESMTPLPKEVMLSVGIGTYDQT